MIVSNANAIVHVLFDSQGDELEEAQLRVELARNDLQQFASFFGKTIAKEHHA